jgi:hypothetical protein
MFSQRLQNVGSLGKQEQMIFHTDAIPPPSLGMAATIPLLTTHTHTEYHLP